ncbi:MAG: hypothetical protein IKS69_04195, partial [Erysipelotrichaceae bacterium]|nr:hypothetical protein [Erysipelotrichaceae bacterium]
MKRILTILLTVIMLSTSVFTTQIVAAEDGVSEDSYRNVKYAEENDTGNDDGFVTPPLTFHGGSLHAEVLEHHKKSDSPNETIPSSYDLRDYNLVTKVKDQNPYGTCWSFAAAASAESGIMKKYGTNMNPDLAELQVAYYNWTSYQREDPMKLITNDGNLFTTDDPYTTQLDVGGWDLTAVFAITSGIGFSDETMYPYTTNNIKKYLNGNGPNPCYSTKYRLRSARLLSISETDLIKSYLMNYGALAVSYCHVDSYYNSTNAAYYQNQYDENYANHAVTLV